VAAVRNLLRELGKVNRQLEKLDEDRMRFASLRGQIIRKIEEVMEYAEWDEESCQKVRTLIDPVRQQVDDTAKEREDAWACSVQETLKLFESLLTGKPFPEKKQRESEDDMELVADPE
jgi:predicted transcriptional regulator